LPVAVLRVPKGRMPDSGSISLMVCFWCTIMLIHAPSLNGAWFFHH
jgi:hypothetical protein